MSEYGQDGVLTVDRDVIVQQEGDDDQVRDSNRDQDLPARSPKRGAGTKRTHSEDERDLEPDVKKPRSDDHDFEVKKLIREEDEGKWSLPASLVSHFVAHTKVHITDLDMRKNMKAYSLPTNIDCVPIMDNTFKNLLKKEKAAGAIDVDSDWEIVQRKVQDVMGPLGQVWEECKRYGREDMQ